MTSGPSKPEKIVKCHPIDTKSHIDCLQMLLGELKSINDWWSMQKAIRKLCGDYQESFLGYPPFDRTTPAGCLAEECFIELGKIHKNKETPVDTRMYLDKYFAKCPTCV